MNGYPIFRITDGNDRQAATNLIENPSFETVSKWYARVNTGFITQSSTWSKYGYFSILLVANGGDFTFAELQIGSRVDVTPGSTYTTHAWMLTNNDTAIRLGLFWYDSGGVLINKVSTNYENANGTPIYHTVTRTAPSNAAKAGIRVCRSESAPNPGDLFYADGIGLYELDNDTVYVDGSLPHCRWTGTPHASTSTRDAFTGTTVELANNPDGHNSYYLNSIRPRTAEFKGGGVWRDSPFADGRRLVDTKLTNIIEEVDLKARNVSQDALIEEQAAMRRLLLKAVQYWTTGWQNDPVWIEMKASCETNTRYALIYDARIPEDENPFSQPFLQPDGMAIMDNLTLLIEHGQWQDVPPTESTPLPISVVETYNDRNYGNYSGDHYALTFGGLGSGDDVDYGSDATLDDLTAGANGFTVDVVFKINAFGISSSVLVNKATGLNTNGWSLFLDDSFQRISFLVAAPTPATWVGPSNLVTGVWYHARVTYDDGGTRTPRLWINGVEQSPVSSQAAVGVLTSDAAANLRAGGDSTGTFSPDADIAYFRVSSRELSTADFTPLTQCDLPGINVDTVVQANFNEGSGTDSANAAGNTGADGAITNATWVLLCEGERVPTTRREVFVANKRNVANITHVFIDDGGVFSDNMLNAAPHAMFPPVAAVNDACYFGIDTTVTDSGPFSNLVFDIERPASATTSYTIAWEYWNGAWTAMAAAPAIHLIDHTSSFSVGGVNPVSWIIPTDWVAVALNGVTGYWVRARLSALTGTFTQPTQASGNGIYTVTWPYIEVSSADVGGDFRQLVANQEIGGYDIVFSTDPVNKNSLQAGGIVLGSRSLSRGEDFSAYLPATDEQMPTGVTCAATAFSAFAAASFTNAIDRELVFTPGAATERNICNWSIDGSTSWQYSGLYHVYVRCASSVDVSGTDGWDIRLEFKVGASPEPINTPTIRYTEQFFYLNGDEGYQYLDLGAVRIPYLNNFDPIEIAMYAASIGTATTLYVADLILIPSDEWVGSFVIPSSPPSGYLDYNTVGYEYGGSERSALQLDDGLKAGLIAQLRTVGTDSLIMRYSARETALPTISNTGSSRIWGFVGYIGDVTSPQSKQAQQHWLYSRMVSSVKRYSSGRGSK